VLTRVLAQWPFGGGLRTLSEKKLAGQKHLLTRQREKAGIPIGPVAPDHRVKNHRLGAIRFRLIEGIENMRPASLQFLKALANAPSPSGYELPAAQLFHSYTQAFADEVSSDVSGNTTAVLNPGGPSRIMLAGHIDEIGFVVHFIDERGLLFFSGVGSHDDVTAVGQRVWIHGRKRVPGVVGSRAFHLLDDAEKQERPVLKKLWIDIGASSRAEAQELVQVGDPITFQQEFQLLEGDRAAARGFDNKAGVFIVAEALRLLQEGRGLHPEVSVHAVATVQEEIGSRGVQTAAFRINPVTGLAIDMDHAIDYPRVKQSEHGDLQVGKGPTVSRGPNINHALFDLVTEAAKSENIPYQVSIFAKATPTDAGAMQINRAGIATGLLGVAIRYMHTPSEMLSLTDVADCARLVAAYCRRVSPQTDFRPGSRLSKTAD
jgi:endoglucanase